MKVINYNWILESKKNLGNLKLEIRGIYRLSRNYKSSKSDPKNRGRSSFNGKFSKEETEKLRRKSKEKMNIELKQRRSWNRRN